MTTTTERDALKIQSSRCRHPGLTTTLFPNPVAADRALRATEEAFERKGYRYDPEEWDVLPILPFPRIAPADVTSSLSSDKQ